MREALLFLAAVCACRPTPSPVIETRDAAVAAPVEGSAPVVAPVEASAPIAEEDAAGELLDRQQRILAQAAAAMGEVDASPCRAPLSDYAPYPRFEAAWREALADAAEVPCRRGGAERGDCGSYRFVASGGGYGNTVLFFARGGSLVGVSRSSDNQEFCGGRSNDIEFGHIPSCSRYATQKVCGKAPATPQRCASGDPLCPYADASPADGQED